MGIVGWINTEEYAFDCMLRMERFQIRLMLENLDERTGAAMGTALKANPKTAWLFEHKCPELADKVRALAAHAPEELSPGQVREAEIAVLDAFEDFVIFHCKKPKTWPFMICTEIHTCNTATFHSITNRFKVFFCHFNGLYRHVLAKYYRRF